MDTDFNDLSKYNNEQKEYINSGIVNSKLLGIPGGGKTKSIIQHIITNIYNGNYTKNNQYLIITFSNSAKNDFITKSKKLINNQKVINKLNNPFTISNIRTIHSIAGSITSAYNKKTTNSENTVIISASNALKQQDEPINILSDLKMIYVDEAQDISDIQYEFILNLSKNVNCCVSLIGDPNQNIYQFQNGSDKYLLNHECDKEVYLKVNYRSTRQLVDFYNSILPHDGEQYKMVSYKTIPGGGNNPGDLKVSQIEDKTGIITDSTTAGDVISDVANELTNELTNCTVPFKSCPQEVLRGIK